MHVTLVSRANPRDGGARRRRRNTDILDFRGLLSDYNSRTWNVNNFVHAEAAGGSTTILVSADGIGTDFVPLVDLQGVNLTQAGVADMVATGHLLVG